MAVETTTTMIQAHDSRITIKTPLPPLEVSTIDTSEVALTPPESKSLLHLHSLHLLDSECVTSEFDKLRFEAAAHDQLVFHDKQLHQPAADNSTLAISEQERNKTVSQPGQVFSTLLISSPYNTPGHHLDLSSPHLTTASRLLALALTALKPSTPTYATASYDQALNFDTVLALLRDLIHEERFEWKETSFYVVVFRSQLKEGIDQEWLYRLDEESHREACESGGLLKYWFGKGDGERRNLATCEFWRYFSSFWCVANLHRLLAQQGRCV